jgi:hypothetical protein
VNDDSRFRLAPKYVTGEEAARVLGVSAERARQLVLEKKLQLVLRPVIPMASVKRLIAEREAVGKEQSR